MNEENLDQQCVRQSPHFHKQVGLGIWFRGNQQNTNADKTQLILRDAGVDLFPPTLGGDIGQPTPLS